MWHCITALETVSLSVSDQCPGNPWRERCAGLQLLNEGRTVVAALRDDAKVGTLSEAAAGFGDRLFFRSGVDITNPATLTLELLDGVAQIAIAVGPIFGRTSEGQMG